MSVEKLITERMDVWTGAVKQKVSGGRGGSGKRELTGIKKLRELIIELAVSGAILEQAKDSKWQEVSIGDMVASRLPTVNPVAGDESPVELWSVPAFATGQPEILARSELGSSKKALPDQAVLLSKINPHLNRVWKVSRRTQHQLACSPEWVTLLPGDKWSRDFLVVALSAPRVVDEMCSTAQGMGSLTRANLTTVKKIRLRRPPLAEQHRIVQKVDELMALCDRLEQQTGDQIEAHERLVDNLLETLTRAENATELAENWARVAQHFDTLFTTEHSIDRLKQTILQLAVMGRLVPNRSADEASEALLDKIKAEKAAHSCDGSRRSAKAPPAKPDKPLPFPLPSGWACTSFGHLWIDSFYGPRFGKEEYVSSGGVPTIRTTDMNEHGGVSLHSCPQVNVPDEKLDLYGLRPGDLLITRSGSIGTMAIFDAEEVAIPSAYLIRVRLVPHVLPKYAYIYLKSPLGQSALGLSKTSVGVPNVNATNMSRFSFPLPPIEEQREIINQVDKLFSMCNALENRLEGAMMTRAELAQGLLSAHQSAEVN